MIFSCLGLVLFDSNTTWIEADYFLYNVEWVEADLVFGDFGYV